MNERIGSSETPPLGYPDTRIGGCETYQIFPPGSIRTKLMPGTEEGRIIIAQLLDTQKAMQEEAKATTLVLNQIAIKMQEISVRVEPIPAMQNLFTAYESRLSKMEYTLTSQKESSDKQQRMMLSIFATATTFCAVVIAWMLTHIKWA